MPIFAVHAPPTPGATIEVAGQAADRLADRVALVREGFSKPALLFGPLWLVRHGLWRALIVWLLAMLAIGVGAALLRLPPGAALALLALVNLWLGVEGAGLRSAALTRGGRPLVDVVASEDEAAGERIFFARWLAAGAAPAARAAAGRRYERRHHRLRLGQSALGAESVRAGRARGRSRCRH
ncbi:MAG: DUF2628 domain-containing protein [Rhizobiales bacterium]|nr:DUF2628 domain-containing protein [Hyphomicrobiales bacterium]